MAARGTTDRLIDHYLPIYDVRTHYSAEIAAPAADTYRAAKDLDLGKSLPVAALFAVRTVPHLLTGKVRPSRALTLQTAIDAGFVVLAEEAPREFVMGSVGKFWRPDSGIVPIAAEEFKNFDEPGYAKGILNFTVDELGSSSSTFATETRVACTDASARRKFSLYWKLVGPFSGVIRSVMLSEVRRSAEASSTTSSGA